MSLDVRQITPTNLRDYAKSLGWTLLPEAVQDGLYVLSHVGFPFRQLVFPTNTDAPDYSDAIKLTIVKLSELTKQPEAFIASAINEVKDDTLRFRIVNTQIDQNYIPLSYAATAINGAKELFLSAACTVLRPQFHHPRLSRSEAIQLINKSRFRHTEKGSFVLKVSSPLNAVEYQGELFEDILSFARQTTLTINTGLQKLVTAIQADTLDQLVDDIKQEDKPEISSNFCKAITTFQEEHEGYDVFVNFDWAKSLAVPSYINVKNIIKVQKDYFSRIDDVRKELRNSEKQNRQEDTFMASVEHLAGEMDADGNRSGDVILNLYQDQEDEIVKARVSLSAEQYVAADRAHMTSGAFIKIKGKLHPGNQPRPLTDISAFELILP